MNTVVVARKNEDVEWTNNLPAGWKLMLVQKDVDLPDVSGKCVESFYWAIIRLYPKMKPNDQVAFLQGHPFDHDGDVLANIAAGCTGFKWLGDTNYVSNADGSPHDGNVPVKTIYEEWTGTEFPKDGVRFGAGGMFMVPGTLILARPLTHWKRMFRRSGEPRCDWAFERCEEVIFNSTYAEDETVTKKADTLEETVQVTSMQQAVAAPPKPRGTPKEQRARFVKAATDAQNGHFVYAENRPVPTFRESKFSPIMTDDVGFIILCAKWAGVTDPTGNSFDGEGTLNDLQQLPITGDPQPGDIAVDSNGAWIITEKRGRVGLTPRGITNGSDGGQQTLHRFLDEGG